MTVADVEHIMEQWAPRWAAWERDSVGLQVGDPEARVRRIHICLDVTQESIEEAIRRKADLMISHHPLLFRRPASITTSDLVGRSVLQLARNSIALYSAHTNLDFTRGGVSMTLARVLGLQNISFLSPLRGLQAKVAVFVPADSVGKVMEAMARAGAGVIGEYSQCSFQINGRGTFKGSADANPAVGTRGVLESVDEVRLEMILPRALTPAVITAMKSAHPYEEVAYDLYSLDNESAEYGMGAVGELENPVSLKSFLRLVRKTLRADGLRVSGTASSRIRTVAVCGGSGSDLLPDAVRAGADVFLTSDIRYHTFQEAQEGIILVDAGHWETEHPILPVIASRLSEECERRNERVSITLTDRRTSPIHFA